MRRSFLLIVVGDVAVCCVFGGVSDALAFATSVVGRYAKKVGLMPFDAGE